MARKRKVTGRNAKNRKQQTAKSRPTTGILQPARSGSIARVTKSAKLSNQGFATKKEIRHAARGRPSHDGASAVLRRSDSTLSLEDEYDSMKRPQLWKLLKDRNMKCLPKNQDCINSLQADDAEKADKTEDEAKDDAEDDAIVKTEDDDEGNAEGRAEDDDEASDPSTNGAQAGSFVSAPV